MANGKKKTSNGAIQLLKKRGKTNVKKRLSQSSPEQKKTAQEILQFKNESAQRTAALKEAFQSAVDGFPLAVSLSKLTAIVTKETSGDARCAFYIVNDEGTQLYTIRGAGNMPESYADKIDGFAIGIDSLACGLAVPTGRPVLTPDVNEESLWKPWTHLAREYDFRGCWSFPMKREDKTVGTFAMYFRHAREATPDDLALADAIAQAAAVIVSSYIQKQQTKKAVEAVRQSEESFRVITSAALAFAWICSAPDGSNIFFNDQWYEYTGQSRAEAAGFGWTKAAHPEDWKHIEPYWQRCQITGEVYEGEVRYRRHDGIYRWFAFRALPRRNSDNKIEAWYGLSFDINDSNEAQEALRTSEEQIAKELADTKVLQAVSSLLLQENKIEHLSEHLVDAAMQMMHSDFASMQMFVPERDELQLLAWRGFHPESAKHWQVVNAGTATTCSAAFFGTKKRVIVPDTDQSDLMKGTEDLDHYHLSGIRAVQSTPLITRSGELIGLISTHWKTVHEPTERELNLLDVLARQAADFLERRIGEETLRKSEEHLKQFNTLLEQQVAERTNELNESRKVLSEKNKQLHETVTQLESFNYIASHDLQEPLRKIQTYVELVNEYKLENEELNSYIGSINESSARMSELIKDLLAYSRLSRPTDAFQSTDLNKILENVKTDYEITIKEKQATVVSDPLPAIRAIPFQMHQLFSNIISNSLKFSERNPEIKISSKILDGKEIISRDGLDLEKKYAELKFTDNGIGFDNQYNERIFQLFQRLHPKSKYSGTGIGLSIVDRIVHQHKGLVRADGKETEGAVFTVYLPLE